MLRILSAPVLFALELTPACNNRCVDCLNGADAAHRADGERAYLRAAEWEAVIQRIAPHAHRCKLTGGEPTLHPDFEAIVAALEARGIEFTLFTNGRWRHPERLLDRLTASPTLAGMLISLHGAHADSHEAFTRVRGSFDETVENIRYAAQRGIPISISAVLTRRNLGELRSLVALAQEIGARRVVFNRYLDCGSGALMPSDAEMRSVVAEIAAWQRAGLPVKFGNCVPQCFTPNPSSGCLAAVAYCAVDPFGYVKPCTRSSLRAGHILRQPLEEIWRAPAMERFRAVLDPACHACSAFANCHGGCKALALEQALTADPLARPGAALPPEPPTPLSLDPEARPVGRFRVRRESWGLILLRGNRVVPVRTEAAPLLEALDGEMPLADIQARFGAPGLTLVGDLYRRGLVQLR